jgi:hypothetical protein
MEQSPWEVITFSASKNIFSMLWNQKIHHRIYKSPLAPFLCQMYPIYTLSSCSYKTHFNISLPFKSRSSKWFLSFRIYNQISICISLLPILATCLVHPIFHEFITWIIFGKEHILLCSDTSLFCTDPWNQKYGLWIPDSEVKFLGLLNCFPLSSFLKYFKYEK